MLKKSWTISSTLSGVSAVHERLGVVSRVVSEELTLAIGYTIWFPADCLLPYKLIITLRYKDISRVFTLSSLNKRT